MAADQNFKEENMSLTVVALSSETNYFFMRCLAGTAPVTVQSAK